MVTKLKKVFIELVRGKAGALHDMCFVDGDIRPRLDGGHVQLIGGKVAATFDAADGIELDAEQAIRLAKTVVRQTMTGGDRHVHVQQALDTALRIVKASA